MIRILEHCDDWLVKYNIGVCSDFERIRLERLRITQPRS